MTIHNRKWHLIIQSGMAATFRMSLLCLLLNRINLELQLGKQLLKECLTQFKKKTHNNRPKFINHHNKNHSLNHKCKSNHRCSNLHLVLLPTQWNRRSSHKCLNLRCNYRKVTMRSIMRRKLNWCDWLKSGGNKWWKKYSRGRRKRHRQRIREELMGARQLQIGKSKDKEKLLFVGRITYS